MSPLQPNQPLIHTKEDQEHNQVGNEAIEVFRKWITLQGGKVEELTQLVDDQCWDHTSDPEGERGEHQSTNERLEQVFGRCQGHAEVGEVIDAEQHTRDKHGDDTAHCFFEGMQHGALIDEAISSSCLQHRLECTQCLRCRWWICKERSCNPLPEDAHGKDE